MPNGGAMHNREHDLLDALQQPCCAICRLAALSARAYLEGVMRDGVNDPAVRDDWRRRGGLCPRHWRTWRRLESPPLSSAIVSRDLLASYLDRGAPKVTDCRACRTERGAEGDYLAALTAIPVARTVAALGQGRGFLCLAHLERLADPELRALLRQRLGAMLDDLTEFIRKSDYRHATEPVGAEGDSWLRGIRALGGDV
jgi:hypothetical protein